MHLVALKSWEAAGELVQRINLVELTPSVLERAFDPFPAPVRTLDALHLATIDFLQRQKLSVHIATYDQRMELA